MLVKVDCKTIKKNCAALCKLTVKVKKKLRSDGVGVYRHERKQSVFTVAVSVDWYKEKACGDSDAFYFHKKCTRQS